MGANTKNLRAWRHRGIAASLGAICAGFLLAGACSDSNSSTSPAPSASLEPARPGILPAPTRAIIVVRDVAGFFSDCGCTGEVTGGLARAKAATHGAREVFWVFVGRLLMPMLGELTVPQRESYRENLAAIIATTADLLGSLENVYWQPDAEEVRFLEASGVDSSRLDQFKLGGERRLYLSGIHVELDGSIRLKAISARCELPREGNRAKDVVILSSWGESTAETPRFRGDLGALVPLASTVTAAYDQADAIIREAAGPLITSWKIYLYARDAVDADTESTVQQRELALMHQWSGAATLPAKPIRADIVAQWEDCGSCHETAFRKWSESRHAGAFDTLLQRNRQRDGRCLACHTNAVADTGALTSGRRHLAVTCGSCHSMANAVDTCKACHTTHTDPHGRYLKAMADICSGASDKLTGNCSRKQTHD